MPTINKRGVLIGNIGWDIKESDDGLVTVAGLDANKDTDPKTSIQLSGIGSIAIGGDAAKVSAGVYGFAIAGKGSSAHSGHLAAVIEGDASVGEGGIAACYETAGHVSAANGIAYCGQRGTATSTNYGHTIHMGLYNDIDTGKNRAEAGDYGLASLRRKGVVTAGAGGVAIAWNLIYQPRFGSPVETNLSTLGIGKGGVAIAYMADPEGQPQAVVGVTAGKAEDSIAGVVTFGLKPGKNYQLDQKTGMFVEYIR